MVVRVHNNVNVLNATKPFTEKLCVFYHNKNKYPLEQKRNYAIKYSPSRSPGTMNQRLRFNDLCKSHWIFAFSSCINTFSL